MSTWKCACAVAAGLGLFFPAGSSGSDDPFLRGTGLAFPHPLPAYGQSLEIVGHLDPGASRAPFPVYPGEREYTWTLTGPVVYEVEEPAPGIRYLHLTFAVLEIREDPAPNSQYSPNPPNAAVPSTFHDGGVLLLGTVTGLQIREIFGLATASGDLHFEGGAALTGLAGDVDWAFRAAISAHGGGIPAGYGATWNLDLEPRAPVPVEAETWGGIKALYR